MQRGGLCKSGGGGGAWTVSRFKGLVKKEGGGVFEGDDTPMLIMSHVGI